MTKLVFSRRSTISAMTTLTIKSTDIAAYTVIANQHFQKREIEPVLLEMTANWISRPDYF